MEWMDISTAPFGRPFIGATFTRDGQIDECGYLQRTRCEDEIVWTDYSFQYPSITPEPTHWFNADIPHLENNDG